MAETRPSKQPGADLARAYAERMSEPIVLTPEGEEVVRELLERPVRTLDTIAAGEGEVPPWRGLGVAHVSDLTDEEADDDTCGSGPSDD